jgi:hypothetical protein
MDTITWQASATDFPSLGAITYTWLLTSSTGNFASPLLTMNTSTNMSAFKENIIYNLLVANNVPQGQTLNAKWTVKAMIGSSVKWSKDTFNIALTRGGNAGVNEVNLNTAVSVYPNPAQSVIRVSSTQNVLINSVQVLDITGRTLMTETGLNTNSYQLENHHLNAGIYFINVSVKDGGNIIKKIVVE